jgi:hypothetical protein
MRYLALQSIVIGLLAGCAGVTPSSLTPVADGRVATVESPVQYTEQYRISGARFHYIVNAGQYVERFRDADGAYFEGPGRCFSIQSAPEGRPPFPAQTYRCGVYVPSNAASEPKLYFYRDPATSEAVLGNTNVQVVDGRGEPVQTPTAAVGAAAGMGIVRALDAAELKNRHFYQDQPKPGQLRQALRL